MRSKTSKPSAPRPFPWREEPACSEPLLARIAVDLARELGPADRVLLEGPMGAGKSTFARALIEALGVEQPPEGSPTFAIAHEYPGRSGRVVHLDFYRLRSEEEIQEAGIAEYFWAGAGTRVLAEWVSLFPEFEKAAATPSPGVRVWQVRLGFVEGDPARRSLSIAFLAAPSP